MTPIDYARSVWPRGFTKPEIEAALKCRVNMRELRNARAIESTRVRRHQGKNRYLVWRFKPYQLPLPLEK